MILTKENYHATEISYHKSLAWGQIISIVSMNTYLMLWKRNIELANLFHDKCHTCGQYRYKLFAELYVYDTPPTDLDQFSCHVVTVWHKYKCQVTFIASWLSSKQDLPFPIWLFTDGYSDSVWTIKLVWSKSNAIKQYQWTLMTRMKYQMKYHAVLNDQYLNHWYTFQSKLDTIYWISLLHSGFNHTR